MVGPTLELEVFFSFFIQPRRWAFQEAASQKMSGDIQSSAGDCPMPSEFQACALIPKAAWRPGPPYSFGKSKEPSLWLEHQSRRSILLSVSKSDSLASSNDNGRDEGHLSLHTGLLLQCQLRDGQPSGITEIVPLNSLVLVSMYK